MNLKLSDRVESYIDRTALGLNAAYINCFGYHARSLEKLVHSWLRQRSWYALINLLTPLFSEIFVQKRLKPILDLAPSVNRYGIRLINSQIDTCDRLYLILPFSNRELRIAARKSFFERNGHITIDSVFLRISAFIGLVAITLILLITVGACYAMTQVFFENTPVLILGTNSDHSCWYDNHQYMFAGFYCGNFY